ncbi:MAG TPA: hypothetical protein VNJ02_14310 [Vicinamibacterales bacterium]|nr:hypothetical protein [Vicinamibacterales bacterium]
MKSGLSTSAPQGRSIAQFIAARGLWVSIAVSAVFANLTGDWIVLPGMLAMWSFWRFLPTDEGPPGLQFSFSFHLFQILAGVFYFGVTQRPLMGHQAPQYHLMMVYATISLVMLFLGFLAGNKIMSGRRPPIEQLQFRVSLKQLMAAYVMAMLSRDLLTLFSDRFFVLTQPILAISALQMGVLYLLFRRLFQEQQFLLVLVILMFETARGFTGFYASFKEPIILALIAAVEILKPRRVGHWVVIGSLIGAVIFSSVIWLGIRGAIREDMVTNAARTPGDRLAFATRELGYWWNRDWDNKLFDVDALANRVWEIYYTALVLDRVPSVLPHEEGALIGGALRHIVSPRFLFPDKKDLPSESEDVRKYSGVYVAGREQRTTIAFGTVAQSYVDFGVPWMFLPPLALGVFLGLAYRWFVTQIHFEEILLALLAVAFWSNLMPYNIAWAKLMGKLLTSMIYVGGLAVIFDHLLYASRRREAGSVVGQVR